MFIVVMREYETLSTTVTHTQHITTHRVTHITHKAHATSPDDA